LVVKGRVFPGRKKGRGKRIRPTVLISREGKRGRVKREPGADPFSRTREKTFY